MYVCIFNLFNRRSPKAEMVYIKQFLRVTGGPSSSLFLIQVHTYLEEANCESFCFPLVGLNRWRCGSRPFFSGWIFQKVSAEIGEKGPHFVTKMPSNFKQQ